MRSPLCPEKGFSLIELVFVLVIIGLLASFGYGMMKNARNYSAERTTDAALREILMKASEVIASSGKIPPASYFNSLTDGYGRSILAAAADEADLCSGFGGINISICLNADCSEKESGGTAAVFAASAGEDGRFTANMENGSVTIYPRSVQNDDVILWTGFAEAMAQAGCGNGSLKIVTPALPPVNGGSLYTAEIQSVPPAEKWCAESDGETAATLNISAGCSDNASFISGTSMLISARTPSFTDSSIRRITVYAERGGTVSTASYAVPFYPDDTEGGTKPGIGLDSDDIYRRDQAGAETDAIELITDEKGGVDGFALTGGSSSGSVCLWINKVFDYKTTFRMYYEAETHYKDNDVQSLGSPFGGYGLAVFPSEYETKQLKCGLPGTTGLGYGGLSFGGAGFILETDLYPDRNFDFNLYPSPNHLAFVPCIYPTGGSKVCLGAHLHTALPSCPSEGCAEPASSSPNWFEDEKKHPMRLELHSGYSDGTCSQKSSGGGYILAKAWTGCSSCSDLSYNYTGSSPAAEYCLKSEDKMNSIHIGFTFGGAAGSEITFDKILFSAD